MGTGESTRKEIPIGTEPRIMKLYGHEGQVSTIPGVIQEDESGKLWKLVIGTVGSESSNYLPQPFHHALLTQTVAANSERLARPALPELHHQHLLLRRRSRVRNVPDRRPVSPGW